MVNARFIKRYDDRKELIDISNFLRSMFPQIKVKIERYIFFNADGSFNRTGRVVQSGEGLKVRNPDITIYKDKKILCCVEIDGSVHDVYVEKTDKRNEDYKNAGIDLIVANKSEIAYDGKNIFEFLEAEVAKRLC